MIYKGLLFIFFSFLVYRGIVLINTDTYIQEEGNHPLGKSTLVISFKRKIKLSLNKSKLLITINGEVQGEFGDEIIIEGIEFMPLVASKRVRLKISLDNKNKTFTILEKFLVN